ncbi:hypothetical protein [Candidatus Lokiarchaeum ossiferum]|uniref:hypothetical protein n=1 Tax=Candidatus Lokiarchaeum ossiferum TaxID=2951803 RepID=UPI00352EB5F5
MKSIVENQEIMNTPGDIEGNQGQEYKIEQFTLHDSDYKEISDLITTAFLNDEMAKKEGGVLIFNEETFRRIFGSPYLPKDLFVRAIHIPTNEVIGFIGCIPRTVHYQNSLFECAIPAWAAVHWKHQRKGISVEMGKEVRKMLIEKGYNIAFSFHEPEQHGKDLSAAVSRETDLIPLKRLANINHFLIRIFDIQKVKKVFKLKRYEQWGLKILSPPKIKYKPNSQIRRYEPEDGPILFELMSDHLEQNEMAIVHEEKDFLWYLNQPGVNCVVHENAHGDVDGFLLAWEFLFAGYGESVPFGWLDLVHTYRLKQADATDLAKFLAIQSKKMGWAGIQMPYIKYFDAIPFKKAKFILFPKKIYIDAFYQENHSTLPLPEKLNTFYFDWR